ncbi:MAG TPA: hypothetical protein VHY79_13020 [Rhizomicrobium sp.]|jgi:hypothetical protein|nr:hypothetical protein [Rhizomicrobium sp.]
MQDGVFTDTRTTVSYDPDSLRLFARVLNGIGFAIGFWVLAWPQPYKLAVLGAMTAFVAALAVKLLSRQRLGITDARGGNSRPGVQALFLMPALVVPLRALQDINLLEWQPVLLWSLALAAGLAIPLFAGDKELPKKPLFAAFLLILTYAYAWGSLAEANSMFDTSAPQIFQTTIRSMHANYGKSTSYHLRLGPWNGRPAGDDVRVPRALYVRHRAGETMCVALRNGWLGFRYEEARSCW